MLAGTTPEKLEIDIKRGSATWGLEADENVEPMDQDVGPASVSW